MLALERGRGSLFRVTLLDNLAESTRYFHIGHTFNCAMAGSVFPARPLKTRDRSLR